MLFQGMGMEFKVKIMLYCFREMKCKQGFATGIMMEVNLSSCPVG